MHPWIGRTLFSHNKLWANQIRPQFFVAIQGRVVGKKGVQFGGFDLGISRLKPKGLQRSSLGWGGSCRRRVFSAATGVRKGPSLWLSPFGQSRYIWVDASEQPKFIDNQLFTGFKRLRSRFLGGGKLFPALNGCRWALFRFAGRSTAPGGWF